MTDPSGDPIGDGTLTVTTPHGVVLCHHGQNVTTCDRCKANPADGEHASINVGGGPHCGPWCTAKCPVDGGCLPFGRESSGPDVPQAPIYGPGHTAVYEAGEVA